MKMRSGFTMIELVFVIVIIGILSAVALPKFLGTANQAHDAIVKGFAGCIATYIDVPDELTDDGSCGFTPTAGKGATLSITFTDGSATAAPEWSVQ